MALTDEGLKACLISTQPEDGRPCNIVDALLDIAGAIGQATQALNSLGLADAATPMGAIELLAKEVRDGFTLLSEASAGEDLDVIAGNLGNTFSAVMRDCFFDREVAQPHNLTSTLLMIAENLGRIADGLGAKQESE